MLKTQEIYYGKDEPIPEMISLRAGPLTMLYDNGDLRYIRYGEHELVRRLYAAVRNQNWDTIPLTLSDVNMEAGTDAFKITYTATHQQDDIHFVWAGTIEGTAEGVVTFTFDGEAKTTFKRNRVGFCVLHPMDLAGQSMTVEHPDGSTEETTFPVEISPHQPVFDIKSLRHAAGDGASVEIRFEGDVFEMEDQRNWTDASYKTYCTPLALPFPVEVQAGEKIFQSITVRLHGDTSSAGDSSADSDVVVFEIKNETKPLPGIGLGMASNGEDLNATEIERLQALGLSHLRVDVRGDTIEADLRQAADQAAKIGAALEIAVHLSDDAKQELQTVRGIIDELTPQVSAYLIFHEDEKSTGTQWMEMAHNHLTGAPIGGGTDAFCTELNRDRPETAVMDFVVFSLNPQVHAFENVDLVETLAAQRTNLDSAYGFSGGKPVKVSPITLKMRWNPNATGPQPENPPGELPSQVDVRQMSLFGAGWTLGSIKYVAEGNADSVTYYETVGWLGVMATADGSPLPDKFPSVPGAVYPMYHVFADVTEFAGGHVHVTHSHQPLWVDGLALHKDGKARVLLANLTGDAQQVRVSGMKGSATIKVMDADNTQQAMNDPAAFRAAAGKPVSADDLTIMLAPFAIARIDGELA